MTTCRTQELINIFVIVGRFIDLDGSRIDNDAKTLLHNLKNITVRWHLKLAERFEKIRMTVTVTFSYSFHFCFH